MQNEQSKLLSRIENWAKIIIAVAGAIGVLWSILMLFDPIGKIDLTVRIEREIPVSLPSDVASLPIRLTYEGRDITSASIVQLEVLNSGATPIGEPEKKWKLDLRSRDGVTVVPLGVARPKPANIDVTVARGPSPDVVSLEIGLFNPKDSIGLELMLVEPKGETTLPVVAETRVAGLSQPITGRLNVMARLRDAFIPPIWAVIFIGFVGLALYERKQLKQLGKPLAFVHTVFGAFLVSLFGSAFLAGGISWVLAWVAANVLPK